MKEKDNLQSTVVSDIMIEGLKQKIYKEIKDKLLNGEEFEIPGVGSIKAYSRKVKLQDKEGFAIMIKIMQDKDFSKEVREEYEKNPDKFDN